METISVKNILGKRTTTHHDWGQHSQLIIQDSSLIDVATLESNLYNTKEYIG